MKVKFQIKKNVVIITAFTGGKKYQGKFDKSALDEVVSSILMTKDLNPEKIKSMEIESAVVYYETDGRWAMSRQLIKALKEA